MNTQKLENGTVGWGDTKIAHELTNLAVIREPTSLPTYLEVESWCDDLNDTLNKYMLLFRAIEYKVEPILEHDWKSIFRNAWL